MKHARSYAVTGVLLALLGLFVSIVAVLFRGADGRLILAELALLTVSFGMLGVTWALTADLDLPPLAEEEQAALASLDYDERDYNEGATGRL
jgi:hypothetical protein